MAVCQPKEAQWLFDLPSLSDDPRDPQPRRIEMVINELIFMTVVSGVSRNVPLLLGGAVRDMPKKSCEVDYNWYCAGRGATEAAATFS